MIKLKDFKKEYDSLEMKKDLTGDQALAKVKKNWNYLQYVKEQTEEICLAAVSKYGDALRYVKSALFNLESKDEK